MPSSESFELTALLEVGQSIVANGLEQAKPTRGLAANGHGERSVDQRIEEIGDVEQIEEVVGARIFGASR